VAVALQQIRQTHCKQAQGKQGGGNDEEGCLKVDGVDVDVEKRPENEGRSVVEII